MISRRLFIELMQAQALTKAVIAKVMAAAAAKIDRIVMEVFMAVSFPRTHSYDAFPRLIRRLFS
jgi:hypothetical protein